MSSINFKPRHLFVAGVSILYHSKGAFSSAFAYSSVGERLVTQEWLKILTYFKN